MRSYQTMLEFGCYPKGKVVLGGFATYSRYAGPKEAVFTALCRKNMGCSHFIIGRDHTGVGDFYPADGNLAGSSTSSAISASRRSFSIPSVTIRTPGPMT